MKINWKIRFKNKIWLLAFLTCILTFAYQMATLCGIPLPMAEYEATKMITAFVEFLSLVGIVIDPTTPSFNDSELALTYGNESEPNEL